MRKSTFTWCIIIARRNVCNLDEVVFIIREDHVHGYTMTRNKRDICHELKEAFGLENLDFYYYSPDQIFSCKYHTKSGSGKFNLGYILNSTDLDFLLKSLNMQQGKVYFKDIDQVCMGMNELKYHYLIMELAGI